MSSTVLQAIYDDLVPSVTQPLCRRVVGANASSCPDMRVRSQQAGGRRRYFQA